MKQLICVLLAALMLLVLFTGCGKTEVPIVKGEPEATLAKGTEGTAVPQEKVNYEVPARFTGEWTGIDDTFTVTADAEILLPEDVSLLSTAKVTRRGFTQEQADKVLEVFLKGNPLYKKVDLTKEQCQGLVEKYEAILRGEKPYEGDGTIDRVPGLIEMYKNAMETAPHAGEKILADTKFHMAERPLAATADAPFESIEGYAEVDGKTIRCRFQNSTDYAIWNDRIQVWEEGYANMSGGVLVSGDSYDAIHDGKDISFSGNEQTLKVGNDLMEALGLSDYTCDRIIPMQYAHEVLNEDRWEQEASGENGYLLEYVRKINGLPLTMTNFDGTASEENATYIGTWPYEWIQLFVLGDRVVYFHWESPDEVTDIQSAGKLMDFQQIQEVFAKMIFVKNDYYREINQKNGFPTFQDLDIDKVQLTLMRVRPKDSVTEGRIIPVWDFWGTETARWNQGDGERTGEPRYGVLLSINAIDGTLVDREIGY